MTIKKPMIIPRLMPMTPTEIMVMQVKGTFDSIRYQRRGVQYIPPHLGGIFGQRGVMDEVVVLEMTDFEII